MEFPFSFYQQFLDGDGFVPACFLFQIFKVEGATNRSHYTFSFLIYGFTFAHFGLGETLVVILVSNLVEWVWNRPPGISRYSTYPATLLSASAAFLIFKLINPSGSLLTPLGVLSVAVSMGVFTSA